MRQQVTRFIPAGYTFVTSLNEQSLAAVNPDGDTLVVVLLNRDSRRAHRITLPATQICGSVSAWATSESMSADIFTDFDIVNDTTLEVTLPQKSIVTLRIPIDAVPEREQALAEGNTYLILPQSSTLVAAADVGGMLKLARVDAADPAQQWTLEQGTDGTFLLRNAAGAYVQYADTYALATTTDVGNAQSFLIEDVDGLVSRIMFPASNDGWDLNAKELGTGTVIGRYAYGDSPAADTRNWLLVPLGTSAADGIIPVGNAHAPHDNHIYDLTGRRVLRMSKGLYIRDGRKYFFDLF